MRGNRKLLEGLLIRLENRKVIMASLARSSRQKALLVSQKLICVLNELCTDLAVPNLCLIY